MILDLTADSGLLIWEAVRRAPEGGVWALVSSERAARALEEQGRLHCPDALRTPQILAGPLVEVQKVLAENGAGNVRFDLAVGRNALRRSGAAPILTFHQVAEVLRPGGGLSLAETLPRRGERLYRLLPENALEESLRRRLAEAEEALYNDPADPLVNWDVPELERWSREAGFREVQITVEQVSGRQTIPPNRVRQWFEPRPENARPSYGQRLGRTLDADEIARVRKAFERYLAGQTVPWRWQVAFVRARRPDSKGQPG